MVVQVNIGNLRELVEIQEGTLSRLDAGSEEYAWETIATVYADIKENAAEKFTITMRHFEGLTPTDRRVQDKAGNSLPVNRLKHGNRILNIEDVLDLMTQQRIVRVNCIRDDQVFG